MDPDEDYFSSDYFPSDGDFSSDSSSDPYDLPQLKTRGVNPIEGYKLQHPRNVNLVQYLKQREQGRFTSHLVKRSLHVILLTPMVQDRLQEIGELTPIAKELLQRSK